MVNDIKWQSNGSKKHKEERERVKQYYLAKQNNKCAICKKPITEKTGHLDHCHNTLDFRGMLCSFCNHGLGFFKDNINILEAAIFYLTISKTPQVFLKDFFKMAQQQGVNNKDEIINFRVSQQKKNSFNQKFSDGERGKVLRWLLDGVLSNRIVVPKEVLQSE
jgi:hypothetical protein